MIVRPSLPKASFCQSLSLLLGTKIHKGFAQDTREEVAKLAMAAANLLVSCPLDFKVGTFSMKYKI